MAAEKTESPEDDMPERQGDANQGIESARQKSMVIAIIVQHWIA
jgi:hypothetical protein